jgi:hypothetical protein
MRVTVALAAPMYMGTLGRHIDDVAVAHAALGDDVVGEFLYFGAAALQHGDFETAIVIEMDVQRGVREIVPLVEVAREPFGQFARLVVVHIDESGNTRPGAGDFGGGLLQPGASEVADRLGAVGVAAASHEAIKFARKAVVDGNRHTLHRCLPSGCDATIASPAAISALNLQRAAVRR